MVLYLRTEDNKTLVDIELTGSTKKEIDISIAIDIKEYTKKFVSLFLVDKDKAYKFADELNYIQELRGWLFESYLTEVRDSFSYSDLLELLREYLQSVAETYNLFTVED